MVSEHTQIVLIKENEEALPISASPEFINWLEKEGIEHQNLATCHQSFYHCENIPSHNHVNSELQEITESEQCR